MIPQGPWVFQNITYNHMLPDQKLYQFNTSSPFQLFTTPTDPPRPLGLYFGSIGNFFSGTAFRLLYYKENTQPFASFLFEKPDYCKLVEE
mmetsp:Transcript_16968/g.26475  ORF Transcript_16968/g.26475 Transcript_16968/m.26475 type:complete len:90 (-) Transcript_16968:40-309(-)